MTLTNQKTLRADLVAKLKTITLLANDADGTAHVLPYFEPNPRGLSPLACVDSAGALYDLPNDDDALTPMRFVIGFWVRRENPATAEDQLNDLALSLANLLRTHYNASYTNPPNSDFEIIEGIPYKFELHFIEIAY